MPPRPRVTKKAVAAVANSTKAGKKRPASEVESKTPSKKGKAETPASSSKQYWLMKSEPETRLENGIDMKYSFDDLKAEPKQTTFWDGVRNYQARNIMRDQMRVGDEAFYYHSNCKVPGIVGIVEIVKEGYPDEHAFDPKDPHYDPKSERENPKWFGVDIKYKRDFARMVSLPELKEYKGKELAKMFLLNQGRLSVQPVKKEEWDFILKLEKKKA